jgi:aspartyl-tRNA(Asn)/glutamyl-tRNA(Gln) amidotransferase subunit C
VLKKEDVLKVSQLARLNITDEEAEEYRQQLQKILDYFDALSAVATEGVEPLVTPTPIEFYMREDVVTQTNTVEDILSNAPDLRGNLFKVPPVV